MLVLSFIALSLSLAMPAARSLARSATAVLTEAASVQAAPVQVASAKEVSKKKRSRTPQFETPASYERAWRQRLRQQRRDFHSRLQKKQQNEQRRYDSANGHRQQRLKKIQQKNKTRAQFVRKAKNSQKKEQQKAVHLKNKATHRVKKLKLAQKQAQLQKRLQPIQNEIDNLYEQALFASSATGRSPQSITNKGSQTLASRSASRLQTKNGTALIGFQKKYIHIGGKKIQVEVAQTSHQQAQGLMGRRSLPPDQGMLFIYKKPHILSFWMKNTFVPLSIGFFDANKKLINIQHMPVHKGKGRPPSYKSPKPAQYALEVPQGWFKKNKIRVGAHYSFQKP